MTPGMEALSPRASVALVAWLTIVAFVGVAPWGHVFQIGLDAGGFGSEELGLSTDANAIKKCGAMLFSRGNPDSVASYPICTHVLEQRDKSKPCNVLSFGVFDDPSFESLFGAKGCRVDSYDPSIGKPTGPSPWAPQHGSMFYNEGIGPTSDFNERFGWQEVSLMKAVHRVTGSPPTVPVHILKMDVEGAEWAALSAALDGGVFDPPYNIQQILVEVHFGATGADMSEPGETGTSAAHTWDTLADRMITDQSSIAAQIGVIRRLVAKGYRVTFRRSVGSVWNRERYVAIPGSGAKVRGQYDVALIKNTDVQ